MMDVNKVGILNRCGSGYFRRLDGTTQKMTKHEFRLMFQENETLPFEALREAIANAIIHRDYSVHGTSLMVEVYDDRVEIVNLGVFPWHRKKEFGKISVRRNERIADLFFRMDKVERAGTGIRRMREAMAAAGLPAPKIKQTGFYTIAFKRPVGKGAENLTREITQKIPRRINQESVKYNGIIGK